MAELAAWTRAQLWAKCPPPGEGSHGLDEFFERYLSLLIEEAEGHPPMHATVREGVDRLTLASPNDGASQTHCALLAVFRLVHAPTMTNRVSAVDEFLSSGRLEEAAQHFPSNAEPPLLDDSLDARGWEKRASEFFGEAIVLAHGMGAVMGGVLDLQQDDDGTSDDFGTDLARQSHWWTSVAERLALSVISLMRARPDDADNLLRAALEASQEFARITAWPGSY